MFALAAELRLESRGGGAENAGVENAGVENAGVDRRGGNAGAITYGKPKFEKRLTVFTASNLKTVAKVHNYLLRRM